MGKVAITAHAGCEATQQDSIAALEAALALGADCAEVDVRLDEAGCPCLSHNRRASYADAVPLARAFELAASSGISLNCDLKEPAALYPVLTLAQGCGLPSQQLIFSGAVSCDLLASDPGILRRCQVFLNIEELLKYPLAGQAAGFSQILTNPWQQLRALYPALLAECMDWLAQAARGLGIEVINLPFEGLTPQIIAAFRARGLALSLWTVNQEEDLARLLQEDIRNITTKNISAALRLRSSLAKASTHQKEI